MSNFAPVYDEPPAYASPEDIARYCADAREAGLRKASRLVLEGHLALAFLAIVEATEAELSAQGFGHVSIPATEGFSRLSAITRERQAARLRALGVA